MTTEPRTEPGTPRHASQPNDSQPAGEWTAPPLAEVVDPAPVVAAAPGADPTARGWARGNRRGPRGFRGPGGGSWGLLPIAPTFRGTSVQACGLWPFAGGSSRPAVGVPVGQDIQTGSTVCCDPFSWFRAGLISAPSMSVFGLPGFGKSSFTLRQMIGCAAAGIVPVGTGDLKGEYSDVTHALGGQVQRTGPGDHLNVLDLGALGEAADRCGGARRLELRNIAMDRAALMVSALVGIVRRSELRDYEYSLIVGGIRVLHDRHLPTQAAPSPTLDDLAALLEQPSEELRRYVLADDDNEYRIETRDLRRSLQAVLDGPLGRTFSGQSTEQFTLDAPAVSLDLQAIEQTKNESLIAAVMVAGWSSTFAAIEAANALADAGVAPQRNFLTVMDEMWRPMRLEGAGLVDKLDSITRLNRSTGVGNIFVTHSLRDMESMSSAADIQKARGFAERSGIVVTAALAKHDLRALSEVKRLSETEIDTVAGWSTPPGWVARTMRDPVTGADRPAPPPDAGKVLIKIGERAGIQTQVRLTPTELALHDTNSRWITPGTTPGTTPGVGR